ncbi:hypothetical protein F0562_000895 [Nyssa sinensis]|uniref:NAB domain-containing protein n=1 Tax=Nyssa sinensis TaxID=561372 RepID=A0A5J5C6H5_9ASTE|nr:hypothetical protein F0562_000895 [Nyssa sinensis]
MYYKKRPELINMVEDIYRAHRSLVERYDQVKSDPGTRLITPWASPLSFKYRTEKLMSSMDKSYDSYSETYDPEESGGSEVDDPEQEDESQVDKEMGEEEVSSGVSDDELIKLREEIERLKEENEVQREHLLQKDEEKREVIRQLSLAVDMLKEENVKLRRHIAKESPKKWNPLEFNKLRGLFLEKLFNGSSKSQAKLLLSRRSHSQQEQLQGTKKQSTPLTEAETEEGDLTHIA